MYGLASGFLGLVCFGGFIWVGCGFLGAAIGGRKNAGLMGLVFGLLLGPLGVIAAFFLDHRPQCPSCCCRLEGRATFCPVCHLPIFWHWGRAYTLEAMGAIEAGRLKRKERWGAAGGALASGFERCVDGLRAACSAGGGRVIGAARALDAGLQSTAGEDGEILYRFFQVLAYGILPLLLVGLLVFILV